MCKVSAFHVWGESLISVNQMCLLPRETTSLGNVPPASSCPPPPHLPLDNEMPSLASLQNEHGCLGVARAAQSRIPARQTPDRMERETFDLGQMQWMGLCLLFTSVRSVEISYFSFLSFSPHPLPQSPGRQGIPPIKGNVPGPKQAALAAWNRQV